MAPRISLYFYKLSSFVSFWKEKADYVKNSEVVYLPSLPLINAFSDKNSEIPLIIDEIRQKNVKVIIALPYVMRGKGAEFFKNNYEKLTKFADGFLLGNIGDVEAIKNLSEKTGLKLPKLYGDYSLNVTNTYTARYFSQSLESVALSPELDTEEQLLLAKKFPEGLTAEICLGHNIIVMRSEHCYGTEKEGYHCGGCGKQGDLAPSLSDVHGNIYPLICNPLDCNCIMLAPRGEKTEKNAEGTLEEIPRNYRKSLPCNILLRFSIL